MHRKSVYVLLAAVAVLIVTGFVMLCSTGAFAQDSHGNPTFFIRRQGFWLAVGLGLCWLGAVLDYHFWERTWTWWFGLSMVLLLLCFVPPIGQRINGSARWVNFVVVSFQPSELAKLAAVTGMAWWFSRQTICASKFTHGFLIPCAGTAMLVCLIALEVDMGTSALITSTMLSMMFVAGASVFYVVGPLVGGLAGMIFVAMHLPERLGRLMAFMDLERYREGAGLQQYQALVAFGSGGVSGMGLGNGRQKMAYLPFAHTDFIFPMIGEELGLRCTLLVVLCYLLFILCGSVIATRARDRFGMLLATGIVVLIALQAALNIGVTTALLPNKGLPLPFISYGGSNLALCLLCVGILINIYRQGLDENVAPEGVRLWARTRPGRSPF